MAKLSMDCKKMMIKEVSTRLKNADTLIVTNYKGLTSQDMNELRKELRTISGEYVVVKDSILKRALTEGPINRITEFVEGEVGIAVDKREDPTHISKILIKFSKAHEVLKIRGGMIKGGLLSREDIALLAALPSREVLLSKLANVLNAPIQGIASVLNGIVCKIVYALNAVKGVKEKNIEAKRESVETKIQAAPDSAENKPQDQGIKEGENKINPPENENKEKDITK